MRFKVINAPGAVLGVGVADTSALGSFQWETVMSSTVK